MGKARDLAWLFFINLFISAFTFGGGYVVVPMIRRYYVDGRKLFTQEELMGMAAMAQSTPGAIAINLSALAGYKVAGLLLGQDVIAGAVKVVAGEGGGGGVLDVGGGDDAGGFADAARVFQDGGQGVFFLITGHANVLVVGFVPGGESGARGGGVGDGAQHIGGLPVGAQHAGGHLIQRQGDGGVKAVRVVVVGLVPAGQGDAAGAHAVGDQDDDVPDVLAGLLVGFQDAIGAFRESGHRAQHQQQGQEQRGGFFMFALFPFFVRVLGPA
ncbi:MAG: chromate transporter [Clostridiales bacterium]|jgi:hypothetical protein|nr:chromate transporter [Clostridiales bacterium]